LSPQAANRLYCRWLQRWFDGFGQRKAFKSDRRKTAFCNRGKSGLLAGIPGPGGTSAHGSKEIDMKGLWHRGYVAVKGGAMDCPYTFMQDMVAGTFRLP
jgi:hypothetical protein